MKILSIFLCFVTLLTHFSNNIYIVWYQNVPFSYQYQMEIHLGLLPYPKENDTSDEVSLY
jgi:hypothetical protein